MFLDTIIEKTASNHGFTVPSITKYGDYGDSELSNIREFQKSKTWRVAHNLLQSFEHAPQQGDYLSFAQVYAAIVWVYVAGWVLSTSLADVDLEIFKGPKSKGQLVENPDDPVVSLFESPNEHEDLSEMIENLVLSLELSGMGYWEKSKIIGNLPTKLYSLESYFMHINPHPTKKIAGFTFDPGQGDNKVEYTAEEIAYFKYANPTSIYYGMGSIQPLQTSIVTELFRESYNKTYFENEARPDVVLTHSPDMSKGIFPLQRDSKKKVAQVWQQTFGGARNQRLPVLLESGMDIKILSEARRDMDFREMEKSLRDRILSSFGVPPAMAGVYDMTNASQSISEQIRIFWKVNIPPKCRRIAGTINRSIIRPYDKNYWCKFNLSDITALEETVKEREERLSRMLERGGITIGQYGAFMGMKMDENDPLKDKRVITANLIPFDESFFASPLEETEKPEGPPQTGPPVFPNEDVSREERGNHK